jgi:hypothetical protein
MIGVIQLLERIGALLLLGIAISILDRGLPDIGAIVGGGPLFDITILAGGSLIAVMFGLFVSTYIWAKSRITEGAFVKWTWAYRYRDSILTMVCMMLLGSTVYYFSARIEYPLTLLSEQYAWMAVLFLSASSMELAAVVSSYRRYAQ